MRIRSIRPEFWTSDDIAALCWEHRLIYIGLWSYVDDNGVGRDVAKLIAADLFPLEDDPAGVLKTIHGALSEYSKRQMITRYTVDGKPYLHIASWEKHQKINRPSEGRYPPPTRADAVVNASLTEPSVSLPANDPLGEGEKGRRGEVITSEVADAPADPTRLDVERLCEHLAEKIAENGSKRPTITEKWRTQCRLLLDKDGRTEEQVQKAIDWSQANEFWMSNILSMSSLREKYDQLRLQALKDKKTQVTGNAALTPPDDILDNPQAMAAWYDAQARKAS
jgi:hypothetical protein